ncbi:MAG: alpha-E domain-containing protein [Verrucomicrobiales bacterium]
MYLLSRVASSIYWLSRYIERAENNARIINVNLQLALEAETGGERGVGAHWTPVINTLEDQERFYSLHPVANGETVCNYMTFAEDNPNSIVNCLAFARENARTVREQISTEMWEQINKMHLFMRSPEARQLLANSPYDFYRHVIEGSYLFQGVTDTTMNRTEGYAFMRFGRYLERADYTSRILDVKYHILLPRGELVGGTVDIIQWMAVLSSCSAAEAYRKAYAGPIAPWKVAEFLALHPDFPRSLLFCVTALDRALHSISGEKSEAFSSEAERCSGALRYRLTYSTIKQIFRVGLHEFLDELQLRLIEIGEAAHTLYCENEHPKIVA